MVDIVTSLGVGVIATFAPLFVGLLAPKYLARLRNPYVTTWLVAASAGTIFWFFIDVMGDAVQLDINQGLGQNSTQLQDIEHIILALMFAVGVGVLFGLEKNFSKSNPTSAGADTPQRGLTRGSMVGSVTFAIAAVAALAIGFHALGEGMDIGSSLPKSVDIIDAIGGILPGIAYVLHKLLEGYVVGVFAVIAAATSARKIGILAALSGIPTVIGFFIGLPNIRNFDSSYFFALGGAGALYIEIKLIPLLSRSGRLYAWVVPMLLGFYAMYTAGLFHSVAP